MAVGDIGAIIDSRNMWGFGNFPNLIKGPGNLFIATQAQDARFRTFTIDIDGTNISAQIDTIVLEGGLCTGGNALHIAGDVYAYCYRGVASNWIRTVTIDAAGNVGGAPIASFNLGASRVGAISEYPHLAHVFGNIYVATWTDNVRDGWMSTVQINDDGTFGGAAIDTWEWQADLGIRPFILNSGFRHLGNQTFITVAAIVTGIFRGYIGVREISDAGNFAGAGLNVLFDANPQQTRQQTFYVAPNIYVVFYAYAATGWMRTYLIQGGLAPVLIDTWDWEPTWGSYPTAIDLGYNTGGTAKVFCATKYGNVAEANHLKTIAVNLDGTIQKTIISSLAIDTDVDSQPHAIVHIDKDIYAVLYYRGATGRQYISTIEIETRPLVVALSVTTDPATELGAIAATQNGTLDSDGGEVCQCGFEWGLDTGYGALTPTESKTAGQTFSQVIGGLAPNTTYHFRAFATNSTGTGYGADRTFTTKLVISKAYALAREEL